MKKDEDKQFKVCSFEYISREYCKIIKVMASITFIFALFFVGYYTGIKVKSIETEQLRKELKETKDANKTIIKACNIKIKAEAN